MAVGIGRWCPLKKSEGLGDQCLTTEIQRTQTGNSVNSVPPWPAWRSQGGLQLKILVANVNVTA